VQRKSTRFCHENWTFAQAFYFGRFGEFLSKNYTHFVLYKGHCGRQAGVHRHQVWFEGHCGSEKVRKGHHGFQEGHESLPKTAFKVDMDVKQLFMDIEYDLKATVSVEKSAKATPDFNKVVKAMKAVKNIKKADAEHKFYYKMIFCCCLSIILQLYFD
jgi:hypothetical protein